MQTIPRRKVSRSLADSPLAVVALVDLLDRLGPEVSGLARNRLAIADFHEEVVVRIARFKVMRRSEVPAQCDQARCGSGAVPASQVAGPGCFAIHARANKDDPLDLYKAVSTLLIIYMYICIYIN